MDVFIGLDVGTSKLSAMVGCGALGSFGEASELVRHEGR